MMRSVTKGGLKLLVEGVKWEKGQRKYLPSEVVFFLNDGEALRRTLEMVLTSSIWL